MNGKGPVQKAQSAAKFVNRIFTEDGREKNGQIIDRLLASGFGDAKRKVQPEGVAQEISSLLTKFQDLSGNAFLRVDMADTPSSHQIPLKSDQYVVEAFFPTRKATGFCTCV